MRSFLQRHATDVIGTLSGFDRVRVRGTLRLLASVGGMGYFMNRIGVKLKDFRSLVSRATDQIKTVTQRIAKRASRPIEYLPSCHTNKESVALDIARRDGVKDGLIGVLSCVEGCRSFEVHRDRAKKLLDLRSVPRRCMHYYFYFLDPQLGFMHARLQTWFPFTLHICFNGREWLARQMDRARLGYVRRDNCFVDVADVAKAQKLFDRQLSTDWPALFDRIASRVHPSKALLLGDCPVDYYWSVDQSEWATDVMLRSPERLASLYPRLLRHAVEHFGSREVLRFLARKVPAERGVGRFQGAVETDLRQRPEGIRIKHRVNGNSLKMYDKQGSVLRVETTINDPRDMKTFRPKEGDEHGEKAWRYLRKGVADMHRRAEISQRANERYLESLCAVDEKKPLGELAESVCRPTHWRNQPVRALNPLSPDDARLLAAVNRAEFLLHGFRNRDLRDLLHPTATTDPAELRRRSAQVTRRLRMLRAHGLIQKVPHTHRYTISPQGQITITAILAARAANTANLTQAA